MRLSASVVPSIEYCINVCRTKKERYAGLQFGKECFCGDNYNKYGRSHNCVMKCKSGQICGGSLANSVYKIDTENKDTENKVPQPCTCKASGDPHYRTFDGQMIHFMGTCKYTLATIKNGSNNIYFSVEVKNEHRGNNRVSYTRLVDVKLIGFTIRLLPSNKILINSEEKSLPVIGYKEFSATYSVGWITVTTHWGLKVMFDGRHRVTVTLPPTFADQLTGICGDCNGQKDDFRTKSGEDVSKKRNKFSLIGSSFQVLDDSDKPETKCMVNDIDLKCSNDQTKGCDLIKNDIFYACIKKIGASSLAEYLESCRIDVCIYHNDLKNRHSVFCRIIEGFASECETLGIFVYWREKAKCPMKCNENEESRYRTSKCQPSCSHRSPNCTGYNEGCVCKQGFILSGEQCVHESQCGCIDNKTYMKVNEEIISADCKTKKICKHGNKIIRQNIAPCGENSHCKIQGGKYRCVCNENFILRNRKCVHSALQPCTCKASGDPHYRTFDGQMIHFMGTCKYTLATIKNGSNNTYFSVEVKNEHRGNNRVSYTRLVDVKLIGFTIRLLPFNKILINSEEKSLPVIGYKEFSATYSVGWITVTTHWGLKVMFDGRHRVTVTLPPTFADQLTGICGDCNGQNDDFRTKSGEDVSKKRNKFSLIGSSFQVLDDSDKPEKKCMVNDIDLKCSNDQTKGCDLIKNDIFDACIKKIGALSLAGYLESCRIDVCIYHNDLKNRQSVFCRIIEGFASECESLGIFVNWREKAKCPMKCNENEEFRYRTSKCQPSCSHRSPNCTGYNQGCVCKNGFILSGEQCVHESQCGCIDNKTYMKVNEEIISADCKTKKLCKPGNKTIRQNIDPCGENSYCRIQGGKYRCVCNENFILRNRKCVHSDPCHGEPCKNGATCRKIDGEFQCICTPGFSGKTCSESLQPCTCKASGDPHYRTFDGQMIHFMGTCKYTLATIKNGSNNTYFSVEVKNEHRGNNRVSYTRLVDVKLIGFTIRLLPFNKILVNSEERTLPVENYKSFIATYSGGWITITTNWGLKVVFDGRHRVTVTLPPTFVDQLTGICGDCNGQKDDFRTKSGEDVSKKGDQFSLIGASFQVPDDSDKPETKCDVKDVQMSCSARQTQACNLIRHRVFKTCHQIMGDAWINEYIEACRIDMCSYLKQKRNVWNEVRCRILEGFVSECENIGVFPNWRLLAQCVKKCAVNEVFKYKTLTCQPSCTNRSPNCSIYTGGCVCKPGFILSGRDCISESECGCYSKNVYMKVYEEIYSHDCRSKSLCHINGKIEQIKLDGCPSGSQCKVQDYKRQCICKDGFSYTNNICRPIVCNKPIDLVFMIDDSESIGEENFVKIKFFVKNLMQSFNIQLESMRIGLITTSSVVKNHISLKDGVNFERIMKSLQNITYSKGKSLIHVGLNYIKSRAFSRNFGSRIKTSHIVIAIIGSKSKLPVNTSRAAIQLKRSGINVFVLGIGNNISVTELETISSRPDSGGLFTVPSYDSLSSIKTALVTSMCSVDSCQNSPCKNGGTCVNKAFGYTCQCTANFFGRFCEQVRECTCIVYGDPHYKTFDGEMIHYMGSCTYTLVTTKQGYNKTYFSVEVKNEHRGNKHVTYTRSLKIKLGNTTISLLPVNRILVNSEERSLPILNHKDFSIRFAVGWVVVTTRWGLTVKFDGTHRVIASLPLSFANKLTGICGDCNGVKDDLHTKSGRDVSSRPDKYSLIGDSYRIADNSEKLENSCKTIAVNNSCETRETARCGDIVNGKAFQTCVQTLGYIQTKQFIDSCKIDVCSYKNDGDNMNKIFCQILEGFATQCENVGVVVDWRKEANCQKFCPSFQEYRTNTPTCQPSCLNLKPHCLTRTEGCICQPGYVLSGNQCVSRLKCGCRNANFYMTLKEEMYSIDCNTKYVCLGRNRLQKLRTPCQENSLCTLENNKRVCICDNGYIMSEGKCIKTGTMDFVRVIKAYIKGIPILSYISYDIKQCSSKCLQIDKCKSFNYDTKYNICELFTINAASSTVLSSRGCSHKIYYQRVLSKNVLINGASIINCRSLEVSERISTLELCKAKCLQKKCPAFDYSSLQGTCRIMLSTRTEFQLTGNEKKTFVAIIYSE